MGTGTVPRLVGVAACALGATLAGCRNVACVAGLGCADRPETRNVASCLWSDTVEVHYGHVTAYVVRSGHDTSCVQVDGVWQRKPQVPLAPPPGWGILAGTGGSCGADC